MNINNRLRLLVEYGANLEDRCLAAAAAAAAAAAVLLLLCTGTGTGTICTETYYVCDDVMRYETTMQQIDYI